MVELVKNVGWHNKKPIFMNQIFVGSYRIHHLELQFTDRNFDFSQPIFRVYKIKVCYLFSTLTKLVIKLKENEEKI